MGDALVDIRHLQGNVDDSVAVLTVGLGEGAGRIDRALEHETDRPAPQYVRLVVAVAGLRTGVGDEFHAERRLVEVRCLCGIAHRPHHGVPAGHREGVACGVVLDQSDQLLELGEVEFGQAFLAGESLLDGHGVVLLDSGGERRGMRSPRT